MGEEKEFILKRLVKKVIAKTIGWYVYEVQVGIEQRSGANLAAESQTNRRLIQENREAGERMYAELRAQNAELRAQDEELRAQNAELRAQNAEQYAGLLEQQEKSRIAYANAENLLKKILVQKEGRQNITCIDVMDNAAVSEEIRKVKNAGHAESLKQGLFETLGDEFESSIGDAISKSRMQSWAVVCRGLKGQRSYEAIRRDAVRVFQLLKKYSGAEVRLISIESGQERIETDADLVCLPENLMGEYFRANPVSLVIAMESTAAIASAGQGSLLKCPMIVRLSGQNPLMGLQKHDIDILLHSNDLGVQHYTVQSEHAKRIMEEAGFRDVVISRPLVEPEKYGRNAARSGGAGECRKETGHRFVVGFASSPMAEDQLEDRGAYVLGELASLAEEFDFLILWRDAQVPVPDQLIKASNCRIEYGVYDMERFYQEIDCLLIPYLGYDRNHACSVSTLEAMLSGIPVVCTAQSGVSDLVGKYGLGIICGAKAGELRSAIGCVDKNAGKLTEEYKRELLKQELDEKEFLNDVFRASSGFVPEQIITLVEWENALRESGKYLVKGHDQIKAYYSQFKIAENYNYDRFTEYPLNCIDLLERRSIDAILEDKYRRRPVRILDIAPGDGRIVQEDIKYGHCLAADSSAEMLRVLRRRFPDEDNLETLQMDYLEESLERKFDVVTTFRYIRHFEYPVRRELYKKIRENLKEDGILIFDVPNIKLETKLRDVTGWTNYNIYDMFWTVESMSRELEQNGFRVVYVIAVGTGLIEEVRETCKEEPVTWTFGAIRI
ncbi:MAG: methyltransferase domain-containing protein [Lachnospiraceae bacterium]|nr:methyltransferase domain-containing protein [Lachnospiraceae bacterium]